MDLFNVRIDGSSSSYLESGNMDTDSFWSTPIVSNWQSDPMGVRKWSETPSKKDIDIDVNVYNSAISKLQKSFSEASDAINEMKRSMGRESSYRNDFSESSYRSRRDDFNLLDVEL